MEGMGMNLFILNFFQIKVKQKWIYKNFVVSIFKKSVLNYSETFLKLTIMACGPNLLIPTFTTL